MQTRLCSTRSWCGRPLLLAVASVAALAVVGLMYVSRANRFGKVVGLPTQNDLGVQTVTVQQFNSVLEAERIIQSTAGLETEGERQREPFAGRTEDERELYSFNSVTQSPEDTARHYDTLKAQNASLSQGSPFLHQQTLGSDDNRRHQTVFHQQQLRNEDPTAKRYYDPQLPTLPPEVIDGVEKFVFFIGYPRSGHSIIGSMMDAHPNMIISHEFMLFQKLIKDPEWKQSKTVLFNKLYQESYREAINGWRTSNITYKGYTLEVGTPWHGKFNGSLKVIGDKSGGQTVYAYNMVGHERFLTNLTQLKHTLNIPMHVIHVVRNPYDMIATESMYQSGMHGHYVAGELNQASQKGKCCMNMSSGKLRSVSSLTLRTLQGADEMIRTLNLTVLEIHSVDFLRDPRKTMTGICDFLDLPCPEDYLQACYDKAYKTPSKTRNAVNWPKDVITEVETSLRNIPFLRRYSFEGD